MKGKKNGNNEFQKRIMNRKFGRETEDRKQKEKEKKTEWKT